MFARILKQNGTALRLGFVVAMCSLSVPAFPLEPTFIVARAKSEAKLLVVSENSTSSIPLGEGLAYGSGYKRIAIIAGKPNKEEGYGYFLTVVDSETLDVLQSCPIEDEIMLKHRGIDELLAIGDSGKKVYYVSIHNNPGKPAYKRTFFLNSIDIQTKETARTAIPPALHVPIPVNVGGSIGIFCQDTRAFMAFSEERRIFSTVRPSLTQGLSRHAIRQMAQENARPVYVDKFGVIETTNGGTLQRIADASFKSRDDKAVELHSDLDSTNATQAITWRGSPSLACGLPDDHNVGIHAVVVLSLPSFEEKWRKEFAYDARSFSMSSNGHRLAVLNWDEAALVTYNTNQKGAPSSRPLPAEFQKNLGDAQIIPVR